MTFSRFLLLRVLSLTKTQPRFGTVFGGVIPRRSSDLQRTKVHIFEIGSGRIDFVFVLVKNVCRCNRVGLLRNVAVVFLGVDTRTGERASEQAIERGSTWSRLLQGGRAAV